MSLWKVAWRSIRQRALASALTAFSMGLGVALVVTVLVIFMVVQRSFQRGAQGYDLIVGAKGSPLGLVLTTVFYLDVNQQIQTIPYDYYEEFTSGRFASAVEAAIPICTGHDYRGCQAVATSPEMFEKLTYQDGRRYEFVAGRNFVRDHHYEAVVGHAAARKAGLKVGDRFRPVATRPEAADENEHGHDEFTVVGILGPTGTPNDRAIFMNIEGFWHCPAHQVAPSAAKRLFETPPALPHPTQPAPPEQGEPAPDAPNDAGRGEDHAGADDLAGSHDHTAEHDDDHDHAAHRRISAILVLTDPSRPQLAIELPRQVNEEDVAQAILPAQVITDLFERIIGNIQAVLLVLAVSVVIVAGIGILVSIYNSMSDRRHEIAVMRALGARRATVMVIILLESILLSLGGGAFGLVVGHGLIGALGPMFAEQTGVVVSALDFQPVELVLIPGLLVLATLVGYLPAVVAYRTDVAKGLAQA